MLDKVADHIQSNQLLKPGQKVICAVSGGVDSMVMAYVLKQLDFPIVIAHVGHGLRASESDADRECVEAFSKTLNVEFLCRKVNVKDERRKGAVHTNDRT